MLGRYTLSQCRRLDVATLVRNTRGIADWSAGSIHPPGYIVARVHFHPHPSEPNAFRLITEASTLFSEGLWRWVQKVDVVTQPVRGSLRPDNREGGNRHWLLCPACGRKSKELFLPPGLGSPEACQWLCRICHRLRFDSQCYVRVKLREPLRLLSGSV